MKRAALALATLAALTALELRASPVLADSRAEAVVLFDQGIKDMKAGRLDKACAELQSSLDLVKDSGTKGALARCHGLSGRVASAWLLWRELADTAPSAALRSDAAAQAAKLEPRLPKYTIKLAGATPNLVVEINGRSVASNVSVAVPIDPGTISVSASGRDGDRVVTKTWTQDYTAVEGQTLVIEVPALAPRAPTPPAGSGVAKHVEPKSDGAAEVAHRRHTRHVIALVIGGVALGAAAGGGYFGLQANSQYADAKKTCNNMINQCDPNQVDKSKAQVKDAKQSALLSTILFGGAGAALTISAIVWITAPSLETKRIAVMPTAGPGSVGLVLGGTF